MAVRNIFHEQKIWYGNGGYIEDNKKEINKYKIQIQNTKERYEIYLVTDRNL
jgi:hypothetical protein